jgi:hypothetical protein
MAGAEIDALLAALGERLDEVTARVIRCFRDEIPAYAPLADEELRPGVHSNIERALLALGRGWEPSPEEVAAARALGEHRAQQGLPLDALLQAHRIGVREALASVRADASVRGIAADAVLELATRAWAWADAVMLAAASGHRERELDLVGQEQQQRAHVLRGLLHGGLEDAGMQLAAASYGLSTAEQQVPLCATGPADELRRLERTLAEVGRERVAAVLVGHLDGGLAAILGTPDGGARALVAQAWEAALEPRGTVVALGLPAPLGDLGGAYLLTRRLLAAAHAEQRTGVVELGDLALQVGILSQPEIGELLSHRHLAPIEAEGEFGVELLATLDAWYAHGMRTDETAAALFVHANTVRHRLRRAEELTGLSLQRTEDRLALYWVLAWRQLR